MYHKIKEIYDGLDEAGALHSVDCCCNTEYGCDAGDTVLNCCDNMKAINFYMQEITKIVVDFMSHDMQFDTEEQRKTAVKMYLEEHFLPKY